MPALAEINSTQRRTKLKVRREADGGDERYSSRRPPAGVPAGGSQPGLSRTEGCGAAIGNLARMSLGAIVRRFISQRTGGTIPLHHLSLGDFPNSLSWQMTK